MTKRLIPLLAALLIPVFAAATPTQCMTDQAKKDFTAGAFQVPASACTAAGVPSACCTGSGAGASCPSYKLALITNTSTDGTGAVSWGGNNACTGSGAPYACCTGSGTGTCGAARVNTNEVGASGSYSAGGYTLAGYSITVSSNHSCVTFTTPVQWTSATITARAAVVWNTVTGDVVSIHCLDGGSCAADTSSTGGTFTVNLPAGGTYCIN